MHATFRGLATSRVPRAACTAALAHAPSTCPHSHPPRSSSQLVNYGTQYIPVWGWRLSLGLAAMPACILCLGGLALPEVLAGRAGPAALGPAGLRGGAGACVAARRPRHGERGALNQLLPSTRSLPSSLPSALRAESQLPHRERALGGREGGAADAARHRRGGPATHACLATALLHSWCCCCRCRRLPSEHGGAAKTQHARVYTSLTVSTLGPGVHPPGCAGGRRVRRHHGCGADGSEGVYHAGVAAARVGGGRCVKGPWCRTQPGAPRTPWAPRLVAHDMMRFPPSRPTLLSLCLGPGAASRARGAAVNPPAHHEHPTLELTDCLLVIQPCRTVIPVVPGSRGATLWPARTCP